MKRFLAFGGLNYYAAGGWDDYVGDADTLEDARRVLEVEQQLAFLDWVHIVDTQTGLIVEKGLC